MRNPSGWRPPALVAAAGAERQRRRARHRARLMPNFSEPSEVAGRPLRIGLGMSWKRLLGAAAGAPRRVLSC
ncbi:hypothetical protein ACU4GD_39620 [Cupriavidus basilensis]